MNKIKKDEVLNLISYFVMAVGLIVTASWILDIKFLKTIFPGYNSMKMNTAIGFIVSGLALKRLVSNKKDILYYLIATSLFLFGLASVSQYVFGYNLGIDEFFMIDQDALNREESLSGRPSVMTSICFLFLGMALLGFDTKNKLLKKLNLSLLNIVSIIGFMAVIGYFFGIPAFYKHSYFSSMAIHTAFTFLVLSVAVGFVHNDLGLVNLFLSKGIGGVMMRKLFPRLIAFIFLLGFIRMKIYQHQIFSVQFGTVFFTSIFLVMTTYLLFSTAIILNEIDAKRKEAEDEIILTNKNLEQIVKQRTENLVKQNKQLEDFAHIVSHNLRGSVGNLGSLLYFYKEEEDSTEKEDLIDKFEITVKNIESTLHDLLELVQIKYDAQKERESVAFESVFAKVKQTFEGKIMETGAEVLTDFSKAPELLYSPVYLESIMQNMLSNALKYHSSKRAPVIRFETIKKKGGIVLKISDNGLGIDLNRYGSKIFGLNKVFHDHPEAKGIGLFMTKAQIEGMGGEISVDSEVDKGTTFKIFFNSNSFHV